MLSGNDHAPDTPAVTHSIMVTPATTADDEWEYIRMIVTATAKKIQPLWKQSLSIINTHQYS